jgi:hypothetical protein
MDELVRDAEASVSERMVDGTIEHARLRATLAEIDAGAYAGQIALIRKALATSPNLALREALLAALTRVVTEAGVPVAMVQIVAMAFYRSTWQLLRRIDPAITLDAIRVMETWRALAMMDGFAFGRHRRMPVSEAALRGCVERLRRTLLPSQAGASWVGPAPADGPGIVTPDPSEGPATTVVRNGFFSSFFVDYLVGQDGHGHELVIDVLESALAHPESMPFLRGATPEQRAFRISQLARTLVVLHDLACRLALQRERIPAELADAPVTVQAAALAKAGIGATAGFDHLLVECLYADFSSLVGWVRQAGPRLRIPRVASAPPPAAVAPAAPAPQPVRRPATPTPTSRPAVAGSTSSAVRPAIGPTVGISPFGWTPEPESRIIRKATALQSKVQAPPARGAIVLNPRPQAPKAPSTDADADKCDTEVIDERI